MPEYLAPGVFIEETSFRSKSIEGVSTTTTGFIGPTRYGPIDLENPLITSVAEFERVYGDRKQLAFNTDILHNYMWHAVRAFFEEGGKRLYISRVFRMRSSGETGPEKYTGFKGFEGIDLKAYAHEDGHARALLGNTASDTAKPLRLSARYPGAAGNVRVRFTLRPSQNVLSFPAGIPRVSGLMNRDIVLLSNARSADTTTAVSRIFYRAALDEGTQTWTFHPDKGDPRKLSDIKETDGLEMYRITVMVSVAPVDDPGATLVWDGLALDPSHTRAGAPDSLTERFARDGENPSRNREVPIAIDPQEMNDGLQVLQALIDASPVTLRPTPLEQTLDQEGFSDEQRSVEVLLTGGNDGSRPTSGDYAGEEVAGSTLKTGLFQFQDLEDISIVAAPGSTFGHKSEDDTSYSDAPTIMGLLISHCQRMKYRIAVLDSGNGQTISEVRRMRARLDSSHAALYYPWVKVMDPVTRQPIHLPPSGFVAGIYARNDEERAVYKAPANEVVNLAIGFEVTLNKAQQEVLNPEGINAFRFFEGRGFRLWGARTVSSDPEWKYVNLRRYFAYLERSIDKGTQWAVFEPNGPQLWANVRRTIEDFLLNEWQSGALLGDRPEKAYFVRCDRTTMTQNDLDAGRIICLVGVAPLRPAEFVIFRIGQWTGDRR